MLNIHPIFSRKSRANTLLCLRLNENVLLDKTPKAPKLAHSDVNYSKSLVPVLVDDDGSALVVRTSALNRCSGFVLCFHFFFTLLPFYLFTFSGFARYARQLATPRLVAIAVKIATII